MSAPWMPLYIADYLADTAHLSAAEHGAYLLLIMHYWRTGGVPCDERQLQRIARMNVREWGNSRNTLNAFFQDGWRHGRIENEIAKSNLKATARAQAGSRGGKAKSLKNKQEAVANATILLEHPQRFALASSSHSQTVVKKDKPKGLSKKGTRLSVDWIPEPGDWAFAASQNLNALAVSTEADKFRDYWISKAGQHGVKLDWPATWRNWVRSAATRIHSPLRNGHGRRENYVEAGERIMASERAKNQIIDGDVERLPAIERQR